MKKDLRKILPDIYEVTDSAPAGEGASAQVWRVRHTRWNKELAVKMLSNADARENIENECDKWIRLDLHPNIVGCYYVRELEGTLCIFCEWCGGGTLHEHIADCSPLLYPEDPDEQKERLLKTAAQIMTALCYTHSFGGYFHGDVKPENIMLTEEGTAKLSDFGCAGIKGISGTRAYFSPEQERIFREGDSRELTFKTDTYSWAVTVLEMIMQGRSWHTGTEAPEALGYIGASDTPEGLAELLSDCLSTDPCDRPGRRQRSVRRLLRRPAQLGHGPRAAGQRLDHHYVQYEHRGGGVPVGRERGDPGRGRDAGTERHRYRFCQGRQYPVFRQRDL